MNIWNYPGEYVWELSGGGAIQREEFFVGEFSTGDNFQRGDFSRRIRWWGNFPWEEFTETNFSGGGIDRGLHLDSSTTLPLCSCSRNYSLNVYPNAWVPRKIIRILRHIEGCGRECRKVAKTKIKGILYPIDCSQTLLQKHELSKYFSKAEDFTLAFWGVCQLSISHLLVVNISR